MADSRQLKIVVQTEIKKGFTELSKQLEALRSDMKRLGELSGSINKLAQSLDKVGNAATVAKNATKGLNAEAGQAVKIVKQYATEQEKAAAKAKTLNAAVKSGTLDRKTALTAETRLIQDVIKKTGDLSVLQSKRGSNGRFGFGGFSTDAVKVVRDQVAESNKATLAAKNQLDVDKQDLDVNKQQLRIQKELAFLRQTQGKFTSGSKNFGTPFGPNPKAPTGVKLGKTPFGPSTNLYTNFQNQVAQKLADEVKSQEASILKDLQFIRKTAGKFVTGSKNYGTPFGPDPFQPTGAKDYGKAFGPSTKTYLDYQKSIRKASDSFATRLEGGHYIQQAAVNGVGSIPKNYQTEEISNAIKGSAALEKALKGMHEKQQQWLNANPIIESVKIKPISKAEFERAVAGDFSPLPKNYLANQIMKQNAPGTYAQMNQFKPTYKPYTFSGGSGGLGFGPPGGNIGGGGGKGFGGPTEKDVGLAEKLYGSYVKLGHTLFLLKYSFLTIFGLSGIGVIASATDKFITLRNQVARTSDNLGDLKGNMELVRTIANQTFSDVGTIGTLFSTINKYSQAIGISKEQVGTVTKNIAAAYAASPGSADAKAAAQYQLIQGITSNRLGGDELRSQFEQAPVIIDMLQKGLAKVRGLPEGQTVDLRDKKNPVRTKELTQVFALPEVTKALNQMLGQQARTFSDVTMVIKNRMVELAGRLQEGTGLIGNIINSFSRLVSNDDKFNAFIDSVGKATQALIGMVTAIAVQGAFGLASKGVGAVAGQVGAIGETMVAARQFKRASSLSKLAAGAASSPANDAFLLSSLSNLAAKEKILAESSGKLAGPLGKLLPIFGGLTVTAEGTVIAGGALAAGFSVLTAILTGGILIAIAALVGRFLYLLKTTGDGINIFNILVGVFHHIMDGARALGGIVDNLFGGIFSGFVKMIDKLVGWLIGKAKADEYIRASQVSGTYGAEDYKKVDASTGKVTTIVDGKAVAGFIKYDANNNMLKDSKGAARLFSDATGSAELKNKKGKAVALTDKNKNPNLPSGFKGDFPPITDTNKGHHRKDPWLEFITDTQLQIDEAIKLRSASPVFRSIEQSKRDIEKKAADVLNLGSFEQVRAKFADKAKQVDVLTEKMKQEKFAESVADFTETMMSELVSAFQDSIGSDLPDFEKQLFDIKNKTLESMFSKAGMFEGLETDADYKKIQELLTKNSFTELVDSGTLKPTEAGQKVLDKNSTGKTNNLYDTTLGAFDKDINARREAFDLEKNLYGVYGRKLEISRNINEIELKYSHIQGRNRDEQTKINDLKAAEIKLIQDAYDLETKRRSSAMEGFKEAVSNSIDQLNDVAGQVSGVFSNVFSSLSDHLVSFIRTGKFGLKSMLNGILDDVTKLFVDQRIMKPIMNTLGNFLRLDTATPEDKILNAHKTGAQIVADKIIGAFQSANLSGGSGNDILSESLGYKGGGFDFTSFLPKDFSFDTSGIAKGGEQGFDFISALDGVFEENTKGGFIDGLKGTLGGVLKGVGGFLSGLLGGSKGGSGVVGTVVKTAAKILPFIFHSGGVVGSGGSYRSTDTSVFAHAKRYHTGGFPGLNAAEIPAILQRGERVLSVQEQVRGRSGNSVFAPNISLTYNAGSSGGSGGSNNPEAQKEHAKLIQDMVQQAMRKEIVEYDRQRSMPGTSAYLGRRA